MPLPIEYPLEVIGFVPDGLEFLRGGVAEVNVGVEVNGGPCVVRPSVHADGEIDELLRCDDVEDIFTEGGASSKEQKGICEENG